jgi:alkanesulfonate monooxygenase SsuD/methylene tetrahydromethanopterin reductase-like flavin-dependent oxidoreductase (luciferase family)
MRVALMIEGQDGVTWDDWLRLAGLCEEHGIEALFRSDHYGAIGSSPGAAALDAWGTICALGAVTRTIRLGTLVSPVTFRHPSLLARLAVTADHVSNGRVEVGMGSGWYQWEHDAYGFPFEDGPTRFARLEEQVEVVLRSWTEDEFDFGGRFYTLHGARPAPGPLQRPHPPLLLGGSVRPRFARLAARFADEVNTTSATVAHCRERRRRLDDACREVGRDPATLPLSLMTLTVVGTTGAEVRDRLRRVLRPGLDVDEALAQAHDRWLVGTVDEVADRLTAYRGAGVSRVMLQQLDHRDSELTALIGDRLVPAVRQ